MLWAPVPLYERMIDAGFVLEERNRRSVCSQYSSTAIANGSDGHTSEIGTVQQVYDGRLTPDIQANTFRNIDRLFPTRTVNRGGSVTPLKASPKPLPDVKFQSSGKRSTCSTTYRSTGWPVPRSEGWEGSLRGL